MDFVNLHNMIGLPNVPYSQTPIRSSCNESRIAKCADVIGTRFLLIEFCNGRVDVFPVKETDDSNVLVAANTRNEVITELANSIQ